jgi:hypothetical protein
VVKFDGLSGICARVLVESTVEVRELTEPLNRWDAYFVFAEL